MLILKNITAPENGKNIVTATVQKDLAEKPADEELQSVAIEQHELKVTEEKKRRCRRRLTFDDDDDESSSSSKRRRVNPLKFSDDEVDDNGKSNFNTYIRRVNFKLI